VTILALLAKHWTWVVAGLAVAAALYFSQMDAEHSARLQTAQAQLSAETKRADDAQAAFAKAQELAGVTAQAHAREIHDIAAVRSAAAAAKEGSAHAPGADDRFAYSDAAYGFMRGSPAGAPAQPGPAPTTGVDR
jgi:hypothetical protein